jgi:dolichyl-phosphate beta-glucosyltransferase
VSGADPRWSVVIPAFNEARRLPRYLDEIVAYFENRVDGYEVIVVDDGSHDDTVALVEKVSIDHPAVGVLRLGTNQGKGAAVCAGMLRARGAYRVFADADGATPIAELERLERLLGASADVAIGSRALRDPAVSILAQPHRVAAGRIFNWLVARLGLPEISDSQCGFKAFTAAAAQAIFPRVRTQGFGFDVELLLVARGAGFRIAETAVNWSDQPGSKVGVMKDGPGMLWQIITARARTRGRG